MVCIAAFIILILIGIVVAFLSIFNRDLGRKYLKLLKKSWHCFSRHVTFRKCDTNFADDVKNMLLKKVVIKKPTWVKPISITIEVASILIVVVTAWSLVEGIKAGLALWTLGTCNVSQPANCMLGADSCALDEEGLNWFEEWGEIFASIPDRLKNWDPKDYDLTPAFIIGATADAATDPTSLSSANALSIVDPGCSVCMQSYKNMQSSTFLNTHRLAIVIYPIKNSNGTERFKNSELIARYIYAASLVSTGSKVPEVINAEVSENVPENLGAAILERIFTEHDEKFVNYQSVFFNLEPDEAEKLLKDWLLEWAKDEKLVKRIADTATSDEIQTLIDKNRQIVDEQIKLKGIPTFLYDGKKHLGLFK